MNNNTKNRIFLTGVACVGKTTIGKSLALLLNKSFFDLDIEVENFFGTTIERLQKECLTMYTFRCEVAKALSHFLDKPESIDCVISLMPSGLMGPGFRAIKNFGGGISIVLEDTSENILKRITFYDIDSKLITVRLNDRKKLSYLYSIEDNIKYFEASYKKADFHVDISGLNIKEATLKVKEVISKNPS